MNSKLKIALGIILVLVSFDGMRVSGRDAFGPMMSLFAAMGVAAPFIAGLLIRRKLYRGAEAVGDTLLSLWPLCVMRLWPVVAGLREWDYSYTLSASERDVAGFMLYLSLVSAWSMLSAWSLGKQMKARDGGAGNEIEPDDPKFEEKRRSFAIQGIILGICIILVGPLWLALNRHASFHSKAWDLGIFAQLCYNIMHGNGLEVSVRGLTNIFADHFSPIMFPVALLYPIFGGQASGLIILQALAVASGVVPLVLMTSRRNLSTLYYPYLIGLVYAAYVPLNFLLIDDFHPIALIVPLILWAFYFLDTKRMVLFYVFLVLAGCCQEEAWIIVGMVGLYLALFQGMRRAGLILFTLSWLFFFWLVMVFIPSFRTEGDYFYIHRYAYLGSSAGEIAQNVFLHPGLWLRRMFDARSVAFIVMMLAPLGFLPLRRPKILFILIPTVFYTLISGYDIQKSIFHQYTAPFIPFLFLSLVDNFEKGKYRNLGLLEMHLASGLLVCSTSVFLLFLLFPISGHSETFGLTAGNMYSGYPPSVAKMIGPEEKVCTISRYSTRLVNRRHLTLLPRLEWEGSYPDKIFVDGRELITEQEREMFAKILLGLNDGPRYSCLGDLEGIRLFAVGPVPEGESFKFGYLSPPSYEGLISPTGGVDNGAINVKEMDMIPLHYEPVPGSKVALMQTSNSFFLKLHYSLGSSYDSNWFFATRCEDSDREVVYTYNFFPMEGLYLDDSEALKRCFSGPQNPGQDIYERIAMGRSDNYHKPSHGSKFKGRYVPPKYFRVLPMRLPDGWVNSLDEYVLSLEKTKGIDWDQAYTIEVPEYLF